jgi:hypothetical protein
MSRSRRRVAAWLVMLGLMLTQLAAVAHACPLVEAAFLGSGAHATMTLPCDGMDLDGDTGLIAPCVAHCQFGSDAVDTWGTGQAACPLSDAYLVVADIDRFDSAIAPRVEPLLTRTTAPPVFASSSRLRI